MQGLVLQLTRAGFLMLLWLFIWSVLRILRTDIYAPTGAVMVRRGLTLRGTLLPARQRGGAARYLVVTEGALVGALTVPLSCEKEIVSQAAGTATSTIAKTRARRRNPLAIDAN